MRSKGMIHLAKMEQWANETVQWRYDIQTAFEIADCFREAYPNKDVMFEPFTYRRGSVSPPGSTAEGFAPSVRYLDAFLPWHSLQKEIAGRAALVCQEAEVIAEHAVQKPVNWFEAFGSGGGGYARGDWKAGSVDFAQVEAARLALPDPSIQLGRLQQLLDFHQQLEDLDFIDGRVVDWVDEENFSQSTLEADYGRTSEVVSDVGARFPITGGGALLAWDAAAAESSAMTAEAHTILGEFAGITPFPATVRKLVRIWSDGTQTEGRGP